MPRKLEPQVTFNVGGGMKQFRFSRMRLGKETVFLAVHSNCAEDDPWAGMFFLPTDTLKVTVFDARGRRLWQRDLGSGMIPGILVLPGDGVRPGWRWRRRGMVGLQQRSGSSAGPPQVPAGPDGWADGRDSAVDALAGDRSQPEHQPCLPQLHPGRVFARAAAAYHRAGYVRRDAAAVLEPADAAGLDADHRQGRAGGARIAHVPGARHR